MNESEKVTINLSVVDLGQIDLLVEEGFYSNRTDFIKAAIRLQLHQHTDPLKQAAARKVLVIGVQILNRKSLEQARAENRKIAIRAMGLVVLANDIMPELAREVIESVKVHGVFRASAAVREALADRMA
jgi:Arc/MetJ-type ribon-helix-helix transcriptional regulator